MDSMDAIPAPILQFLQCIIVGILLATLVAGFVLSQGASYFQTFGKQDKRPFKFLVAYCMFLVLLYITLYIAFTVLTFACNFGSVMYALTPNKLVTATLFITPFIDGAVSLFYAFRAYRVLQNSIIVAVICCAAVALQVGTGLYLGVADAIAHNFRTDHNIKLSGPMNFIVLCGTDAVLTGFLIFGLIRARKSGTSQSTGQMIQRLVLLAVEVNAIPTVLQLVALVLWYTTSYAYLCLTPSLPLIYVFTLLFWLKMRQSTRMALSGGNVTTGNLSGQFIANYANRPSPMASPTSHVHVQTLKEIHVDGGHSEFSDKLSFTGTEPSTIAGPHLDWESP